MIATAGSGSTTSPAASSPRASAATRPLARLAYNYRWAWTPGGAEVFRSVDPHRWRALRGESRPPPPGGLGRGPGAGGCRRSYSPRRARWRRPSARSWIVRPPRARASPSGRSPSSARSTRCTVPCPYTPEAWASWPATSSRRRPTVDFRSWPSVSCTDRATFASPSTSRGGQRECWLDTDPERLPAALVTDAGGRPLTVTVPVGTPRSPPRSGGCDVGGFRSSCWTPSGPRTPRQARWITARLYVGDPVTRLVQYALLGVGGVRALAALGIDPAVLHLNEGHAALASLGAGANGTTRQARRRSRPCAPPAGASYSPLTPRSPPATTPIPPIRWPRRWAPSWPASGWTPGRS